MPVGGRGRGGDPDARDPRRARDRRSRPRTGYALAAARGEDLDAAYDVLVSVAAHRREPPLGARRDARRADAGAGAGAARGRGRALPPDGAARRRAPLSPARARSRTATPARSRRAATARRSARSAPPGSDGLVEHVWAGETRPLLQGGAADRVGARAARDPVLGRRGLGGRRRSWPAARSTPSLTGADRIAANGDTANKIGTYALAVAARAPRHPALRRRADLDARPGDADRRGDPDRGARPRARSPSASPRATPPSTSRPPS